MHPIPVFDVLVPVGHGAIFVAVERLDQIVKDVVKDIQRALLVADVNVQLVLQVTKNIEKRALDEELPPGISRKEHIVRIVYEEITKFLGEKAEKIVLQPAGTPTILLMVGIQGSGKTTTTGKRPTNSDSNPNSIRSWAVTSLRSSQGTSGDLTSASNPMPCF